MLATTPSGWPLAQLQASKVHRHLDAPPFASLLAMESLGLARGDGGFSSKCSFKIWRIAAGRGLVRDHFSSSFSADTLRRCTWYTPHSACAAAVVHFVRHAGARTKHLREDIQRRLSRSQQGPHRLRWRNPAYFREYLVRPSMRCSTAVLRLSKMRRREAQYMVVQQQFTPYLYKCSLLAAERHSPAA